MNGVSEFSPVDKALRKRADWIISATGVEDDMTEGGHYLDVGTGKGHITQQILTDMEQKEAPLGSYSSIDIADKPLKKVQKRERKRLQQVGVVENTKNPMGFAWASAEALPYKSDSLDGVSFFFSMHHVDKDELDEIINEAKRLIKKEGGRIYIAEDLVETEEQRQITEDVDRKVNWEDKDAEHSYKNNKEWEEYFNQMGLEVVRSTFFETEEKKGTIQHGFYVLKLK